MSGEDLIKKAYEAILNSDFEQAVQWFQKAIEGEPNNPAYHYKLSVTLARNDKLTKAIEHAEKAWKLDQTNDTHRYHLDHLKARSLIGLAKRSIEDQPETYREPIDLLKQAISLDPLSVEAYLLLGISYLAIKEQILGCHALSEAVKLDPQNKVALRLLEQYKKNLGKGLDK